VVTLRGQTDILHLSLETDRIVRRLEMVHILGEDVAASRCSQLAIQGGRMHVSDPGRGLVYTVHLEGCQATVCGGPEQWGGPGGIAAHPATDGLLVADTAGHRIVLLDTAGGIAGLLQLDRAIEQPGALAVGAGGRLAVHCSASGQLLVFSLED
jgi:hypothetical protein